MTTWSRPLSIWLMPALLLALGVLVILFDPFGIEASLSNALFDAYQRHAARPFDNSRKVLVLELPALDEDSLVKVTRLLTAQGARLIVFTAPLQPGPSPLRTAGRPGRAAGVGGRAARPAGAAKRVIPSAEPNDFSASWPTTGPTTGGP